MSAGQGAMASRPSGWMVSPVWDLSFIVASPLVIVPALWLLAQSATTPAGLAIPIFAFATLGHHLPGYLRAYGDRDLFARFRTRFLAVPPLLFALVLFLVQPPLFGVSMAPPSSLQLLLVVWGVWHGLMQIYGFMRIYDAKQGVTHKASKRLDLAVCFAIFIAGFLFSDARTFALTDLALRAGLPALGPGALASARAVGSVALALLVIAYLANMIAERRRGRRMGGVKLSLAVATGGIYTFSGLITTNLLLGAAAFEVFHAAQYLAIVWYFNRRLEDRVGDGFGPLRFLFRNRWSSLALYLGSIAGFGSLFLMMERPRYGPIVGAGESTDLLYVLFSAFFVTSSLLHYYYDGFIWKLHDRDTGRTLGLAAPGLSEMSVPTLMHLAKWASLALLMAAVIGLEISTPSTPERVDERVRTLATLTPEVPELRRQLILRALAEQRLPEALAMARRNVELRPRRHDVRADLGRVHLYRKDWAAAEASYRDALELKPGEVAYLIDLARVIARQGPERLGEAAKVYRKVLELRPSDDALQLELAIVELRRGETGAATASFEELLGRNPEAHEIREHLVESLVAAGNAQRALRLAREGAAIAPESARAQRTLGVALRAAGRRIPSAEALTRAALLDPELPGIAFEAGRAWFDAGRYRRAEPHLKSALDTENAPADASFMLGAVYLKTQRLPDSAAAWQRFIERAPDPATGHRTLATRLARLGENAAAIDAYREALRLLPDHAPTHYKLGRLLWDEGDRKAGRRELQTAARLGQAIPPALKAQLRVR